MLQAPQSPEDFVRQLEDPNFQQMMREAMNNPQVVDMMINQSPQLRAMGPQARQILQSDYFRRIMTDPQALRSAMQMQSAMGMGPFGGGGQEAFPAPGVVNTTETPNGGGETNAQAGHQQQQPQLPQNPFAAFGGGGLGANPFGSLLFPPFPIPGQNTTTPGSPNNTTSATEGTTTTTQGQQQQQPQQPANPFAALFNPAMFGQPPQGAAPGTGAPALNPFALPTNNPFLQNPEALTQFMQAMGGAPGANNGNLFDLLGAARPTSPPDNRPPEERYATQLQQLNDMGFYNFDRNIQALRRSGGSVNGAIEYLLSNP
jgi:ubiquilin